MVWLGGLGLVVWISRILNPGERQGFLGVSRFQRIPNHQLTITSPKFNMEPENDGFQKESPFPGGDFSGSMLNFRGVADKTTIRQKQIHPE